jgi:hypothetical protein
MRVDNMAGTFEDNWQRRDDASPKPGGSRMGRGERKELERRYLPWSWATHIESERERSFHASLVIRARLTSSIFLKPKPPRL